MTAKSESKKDAMMTMSADTLAERIRERARKEFPEWLVESVTEFALSELSAAEQAREELQNKLLLEATSHMKTMDGRAGFTQASGDDGEGGEEG